jgi:hypothetical protein
MHTVPAHHVPHAVHHVVVRDRVVTVIAPIAARTSSTTLPAIARIEVGLAFMRWL